MRLFCTRIPEIAEILRRVSGDPSRFPHFMSEARQQIPDFCYRGGGDGSGGGGGSQGGFGWIVTIAALFCLAAVLLWAVLF